MLPRSSAGAALELERCDLDPDGVPAVVMSEGAKYCWSDELRLWAWNGIEPLVAPVSTPVFEAESLEEITARHEVG